jgi:hypothetical protein
VSQLKSVRWLALAVALMGLTPAATMAAPGDTAAYCQQESHGSYAMEEYCLKREREAYDRVMSRGRVEQRILDHCSPQSNTWAMLDYCIRREEEARRRLGL